MSSGPNGHYKTIFEGAFQFTGLLDVNGTLLETNPASLAFCGARMEDVVGRPFWLTPWWINNPAEQSRLRDAIREAADGRIVRYEVDLYSASGALTTLDFSLSPVRDESGKVMYLIPEGRDITGRKRAELALQDALARYQAVLASTLDPVVTIDGYGVMQSVSRSVERVLGYRPEELVGRNVSVLMPEPHRSQHDSYLAKYRQTGQTNILGRTRQFDAVRKDGTLVPIELSVSRVDIPGQQFPLFTGILHDISERKQAEREIRLLQSLALAISESRSLPEALKMTISTICDAADWDYGEAWLPDEQSDPPVLRPALTWARPEHGFEKVEAAAPELTFAPGRGLPGRAWEAGRTIWIGDLNTIPETEFVRKAAALESGVTAVVGVPINTADEPVAVLLFFLRGTHHEPPRLLDLVTAAVAPLGNAIRRKQAEDELSRHRQQLEELVAERTTQLQATHEQLRLADRLAAIGTLAAGLGHDMNNVLLPVRCRLDALEAVDLPDSMREQFQAVRRSIAYLQQLSDGLHLLALDPEDEEASEERTNILEWWGQVGALLRKALPKNIAFDVDIPEDLPLLHVAPHRLTQAVLNLVVNAGEAIMGDGHVRLWAEPHAQRQFVRVGVTDDGAGMSEEVKRRAVDPFFTTKTRGLGTGLGLSLVRGVVQGAGGSIGIESEPGKGTTVTITLPSVEEAFVPDAEGDQDAPLAEVSVADARAASLVSSLLTASGLSVARVPRPESDESMLWVTQPTPEALSVARDYVKRTGGQIVVLGAGGDEWLRLGAITVDEPEDFEMVREAISEAITAALGD